MNPKSTEIKNVVKEMCSDRDGIGLIKKYVQAKNISDNPEALAILAVYFLKSSSDFKNIAGKFIEGKLSKLQGEIASLNKTRAVFGAARPKAATKKKVAKKNKPASKPKLSLPKKPQLRATANDWFAGDTVAANIRRQLKTMLAKNPNGMKIAAIKKSINNLPPKIDLDATVNKQIFFMIDKGLLAKAGVKGDQIYRALNKAA